MALPSSDLNSKIKNFENLKVSPDLATKKKLSEEEEKTKNLANTFFKSCVFDLEVLEKDLEAEMEKVNFSDLTSISSFQNKCNEFFTLLDKVENLAIQRVGVFEISKSLTPLILLKNHFNRRTLILNSIEDLFKKDPEFYSIWSKFSKEERLKAIDLIANGQFIEQINTLCSEDNEKGNYLRNTVDFIIKCINNQPNLDSKVLAHYVEFVIHNQKLYKEAAALIFDLLGFIKDLPEEEYSKSDKQLMLEKSKLIIPNHLTLKNLDKVRKNCSAYKDIVSDKNMNLKNLVEDACEILDLHRSKPITFKKLSERLALYSENDKSVASEPRIKKQVLDSLVKFIQQTGKFDTARVIFSIFEELPVDACYALKAFFELYDLGHVPQERKDALENVLAWITEQDLNGKPDHFVTFLENLMHATTYFPEIADVFLKLPKEKYDLLPWLFSRTEHLTEMPANDLPGYMESLKEAIKKESHEEILPILFSQSKEALALSQQFRELSESSPQLKGCMHTLLDKLICMQNNAPVTTQTGTVQQKLEKLPASYIRTFEKMFKIAGKNKKVLYEMLFFSLKFPYLNIINDYLDRVSPLASSNNFVSFLEKLKELSLKYPGYINKILSIYFHASKDPEALLKLLLNIKPEILGPLLGRHLVWLEPVIRDPNTNWLKNANIFEDLEKILKYEVQQNVRIIPEKYNENFITGLKLVADNLEAGIYIKNLVDNAELSPFKISNYEMVDGQSYMSFIIGALTKNAPDAKLLLSIASAYPQTCFKLLKDITDDKKLNILALHPNHLVDLERLLFLMEKMEMSLETAETLAKGVLSKDSLKYHQLINWFLSQGGAPTFLLQNLEKDPNNAENNNIIEIGNKNPEVGSFLYHAKIAKRLGFSDEDPLACGKVIEPDAERLKHVLVIKAQNKFLHTEIIKIYNISVEKREPYQKAVMDAVKEGYFVLAEALVKTSGKGYIEKQPHPSIHVLNKWHEFVEDLNAVDKTKLKAEEVELLSQLRSFAFEFMQVPANEKLFLSWASKVQFHLVHKRDVLFDILEHYADWRNIINTKTWDVDDYIINDLGLEQRLRTNDRKNVFNKTERNIQTLVIAESLITSSGRINTENIDNAIKHAKLAFSFYSPDVLSYVPRILEYLKDPYFNQRLEVLKDIPFPSRQHTVLAKSLNLPKDKPLDVRRVKVAILGAILWPIRQGGVGSCFGTSTMIQLCSFPDGVKQVFEDYLSLAGKGRIERREGDEPNVVTTPYPLVYDEEMAEKLFKEDNPFARSLEYTYSSLGSAESNPLDKKAEERWKRVFREAFETQVAQHASKLGNDKNIFSSEAYFSIIKHLKQLSVLVYNGYIENKNVNKRGAWVLIDVQTGALLTSQEALKELYKKALVKVKQDLLTAYPKHVMVIDAVIDQGIPAFLDSPQYLESFYTPTEFKPTGLARINPIKYAHLCASSPFADYSGGFLDRVLKNLHKTKIVVQKTSAAQNPYKALAALSRLMNNEEIEIAKKHPYLKNVNDKTHGFNFKIAACYNLFHRAYSPEHLWEADLKALDAIEKTVLIDEDVEEVISSFKSIFDNEGLKQFEFYRRNSQPKRFTVRSLCDFLFVAEQNILGQNSSKARDYVERAFRGLSILSGKFPRVVTLFDTNWNEKRDFGFAQRIYGKNARAIFPNRESIVISSWDPGELSGFSFYQYNDSTHDLKRSYYVA